MASACDTCQSFKTFGKKCWFYWEGKQTCTQYRGAPEEYPHYKSVEPALLQIKMH